MGKFEEGLQLVEKYCGGGKDNVVSLATIDTAPGLDGLPCPVVRDVDALYDDGVFYITTSRESSKMRQGAQNDNVAFSLHFEGISGRGIAKDCGWVLRPENASIREKLRKAFADWYDAANNEQDENCVILAVKLTKIAVFIDHGAIQGTWTL